MSDKPGLKIVLTALVVASILINFIGVTSWDGSWGALHNISGEAYCGLDIRQEDRDYLNGVWWNAKDLEIAYYAKRFFARVI